MDPDELIRLIEQAFPTHPIPKVTLRQRTLSDQGMARDISHEEWENAGRIDRDVPWTALSDNGLMECEDGIPHLTAPEFAYYQGALLHFAVRHLDASIWTREGSLVGSVLFFLTTDPTEAYGRSLHALWEALDATQTEVVRRFLEHVAARSDRYRSTASHALARYWNATQAKG